VVPWRSISLVMSTAFCIGVTLGLFPALIALNVEYRGFDTGGNGLLAAMPALAGIAVGPFAPRIIDRLEALPTYLAAAALAATMVCLFPLFPDFVAWFAIRFAMGLGMGVQWIVSEMWVNRLAIGPRRGAILGLYVVVLSVGLTAGPFLMNLLGTRGAAPFYGTAGLLVASCLPLFFASGASTAGKVGTAQLTLAQAVRRSPAAMLAGVIDGFIFQTFMIFLALYFLRLGTAETVAVNFLAIFFLGGILLQFVIGHLLDLCPPRAVLIACCLLIVSGLAIMAGVRDVPLLIWPTMLVIGGASAAVYTSGLAGIADSFSAEEMPSGTAAFSVLWYVRGLTGPVAAGYAMDWWNPHGMALMIAAAALALATVNALRLGSQARR